MQQASGRSRWLGWSGGAPEGPRPSNGGAAPSAGNDVALRLLRSGRGGLLLLALTQAGLECWQVRAWLAMTVGLAGALAHGLKGLVRCSERPGHAVAALTQRMAWSARRCPHHATGLTWQHVQQDYITA